METGIFRAGLRLIARSLRIQPVGHVLSWLGAVLYALASVGLTVVLGRVIDQVVEPGFSSSGVAGRTVLLGGLALAGVGLARTAGAMGRRWFLSWAEFATQRRWRTQLLDRYLDVPMEFHQVHPAGRLLAHADADLESATRMLKPLAFAIGTAALAVASFVTLLLIHPLLAVVAVVLFPMLFVLNRSYTNRVAKLTGEERELTAHVSTVAHESFDGALTVKTLGREEAEVERFDNAARDLRDSRIRIGSLRATFEPMIDALPSLGIVVLLVIGAWLVGQDEVTVGQLVSAMAMFTILALPIRIVGFFLQELPMSVAALDRVDGVLAAEVEEDPPDIELRDGSLDITFDAVTFAYPAVADEPSPEVLRGLSLSIPAGSTVALVGSTGSGKSTIAGLLGSLAQPTSGRIMVGGSPLDGLSFAQRSEAVSLVFQEAFLFAGSIRDNVALGRDLSDADVAAALRAAQAEDFVAEMDGGVDAIVGERGVTLSGGQRQRVALARALARRPRVLVLDDATSAVDPSVEAAILAGLDDLRATVVLVAYRLATIRLADQVVYLVDGRMAGMGSHDELMGDEGYAALVRAYESAEV